MSVIDEQQKSAGETAAINDHPAVLLPDASFLYYGSFEKVGFDLVVTNADGEIFIVADYFSFIPPPNLTLPNGAGLSPEMVAAKLHLPFEDVMFAGPANSANALEEIGTVTLLLGDVTVKRRAADGSIEEVKLSRGDTLYEGDEITTGNRAFVKARMLDGTRFHLGKNANATLTDFEFNESARQGNFEAFVQRGGFHYKSGKIGKMFEGLGKNHATISTPSALIGIRGSELDGLVDENGNTLIRHTSGELVVMDINNQSQTLLTSPGNTSMVTINGVNTRYETPTAEQEALFQSVLPPADTSDELIDLEEEASQEEETPAEPEVDPTTEQSGAEEQAAAESDTEAESALDEEAEASEDGQEEDIQEEDSLEEDGQSETDQSEATERSAAEGEQSQNDDSPGEALAAEERAPDGSAQVAINGQASEEQAPTDQDSVDQGATGNSSESDTAGESDTTVDGPSGVTIRESSFVDTGADIIAAEDGVIAGTQNPAGTRTGGADGQQDTGSDLEILEGSSTEENDTDNRSEDRNTESDTVQEELLPDNPPVARNDFVEVREAGAVEVTQLLLNNDSDGDPGQEPRLAQISGSGSLGGRIEFSGDRAVYVPDTETLENLRGEETATETFSYRIVSGDLSDTATLTVRLVGTNLAPVAEDDRAETIEDNRIAINVLANDEDPDGDALTIVGVNSSDAFGSVTVAGDGKGLIYTPPDGLGAGQVGEDVFTYRVSDGQYTDTASITVQVTGRNDPPVINTEGEAFEVKAGSGATTIPLDVIFADADLGDELQVVSIDTTNTKGVVTIGSIIYDDNGFFDFLKPGETATDSFGVTAQDQNGAQGSGFYTVVINGVNDAPVAVDDAFVAVSGESITGNVLSNDSDIDGDELVVVTGQTQNTDSGELTILPNGNFLFTPKTDFEGLVSFQYTVTDGELQDSAIVTIAVDLTNDAPITEPDFFTVGVEASVIGNVLDNDIDPEGQALTVKLGQGPEFGTLNLSVGGVFEYKPNPDTQGQTDSFSYIAQDAAGRETQEIVTIDIVSDNLPPQLVNEIPDATIPFGQTSSIDLNNFFSDPEGVSLEFAFSTSAGTASFSLAGSILSVTPPASAEGESVTVNVGASDGQTITPAQFVLTVGSQNQAPVVANPVANQNILIGTNLNQNVSSVFSDPDTTDTLTFSLQTNAPFLTLTGAVLSGTPTVGQAGTYSVQLIATDLAGATATEVFTLSVASPAPPVNNPSTPLSGDQVTGTTTNTLSSTFVAADSEGLPATGIYSIASPGAFGTPTIDADTGAWIYTVDAPPYTGTDVFTVNVTDATGDVTTLPINILIRPIDIPGSLAGATTDTTTENVPVTNSLSLVDSQGIAATNPYSISTLPTNGTVTIDASGVWTYTPANGYTGGDSFIVTALDGFNYPSTQAINLTINPLPAPNNPATGNVDITGNTEFGNILTAMLSGVTDADGLSGVSYQYEWFVDGVSQGAPGATSTFTTTISDVGKAVTVDVTFTDDLGFGEFLTDTVFISPQDPNVSGTQAYTFIPAFNDDVLGSNGLDTITAINAAESGDYVDLGDGIDTLILADGVNNTIEIEGVENLQGGNQTDTVTLRGSLFALDGILSNRTAGDLVENRANIQLFDEVVSLGAGVYDFTNEPDGLLQITSSSASTVNLQEFSSNTGTVILDGSGTSTLSVLSGNFNHNSGGNFLVQGLGNHRFDGQFYNGGNLQIGANFTIMPGGQLDLTFGGSFSLYNNAILTFDNSRLYADNSVFLGGSPSETVRFVNSSTLYTDNTYQHYANNPQLEFDGTSLIDGDFLLGVNTSLTLFGDSANGTFNNQGFLTIKTPGPTTINSLVNEASGYLQLASDATDTSSVLLITTNLTNDGHIELDNTDNTINLTSTLTVGGTLTNNAGGVIISRDDDQMLNPGERHTIDATLINDGRIRVFADLEVTKASGDHDINGTIELREDGSTFFGGELHFINANTVDFGISSIIDGHGTITSNVPINHQGAIEPDENNFQGVITFDGDLDLSGNSAVELTVYGGGAYDQLIITGQLDAGNANLKIDFEDSTSFTNGGTIDNVIDFGTLINDFDPVIMHNLGAGYTVTLVNDGGAHYDLNIVASFDTVSNNATFNWTSAADWTLGVPTVVSNALIDGDMVTYASAGTSQVNSVTLANSGALDIDNGTLVINAQSRVDFTSGLSVNPGPGGILQLESDLIVEGTLALNGGTITSTSTFGFIDVIGNMTITLDNNPTLDVQVANSGTLTVSGSTGSVTGSEHIFNQGILQLEGNGNIDLPIDNFNGGIIEAGSTSSTIMVTHSQNVDNFPDGIYRLDTPGIGAQTTVELNNGAFSNQGLLQIMDSGSGSGPRLFDTNGFMFSNNGGVIDVQAAATIDIEGGSLDNQNGDIYVAPAINLSIDGGTGGNIDWDSASSLSGSGTVSFVNTVTLTLMSDAFLNSPVFIDTAAGDLTITGAHQLFLDAATLSLNSDDVISTSSLQVNSNLELTGDNISVSAPTTNFGTVSVIGGAGAGTKTFSGGFNNFGNVVLGVGAGELNALEVTSQLINNQTGFIQSADTGGAASENVIQAELDNAGTLQLDHDLILDNTGTATHENKGIINIDNGSTLTIGANDALENIYDDLNGEFGVISGDGLLDVSGAGVVFSNDGILQPGGEFVTDTLTIQGNANTVFEKGSVIEIELDSIGNDQLVLNGFSPELNGRLRLSLISTPFGPYTIINAAAGFAGLFSTIEGTDLSVFEVLDVTVSATDIMINVVNPDLQDLVSNNNAVLDATGFTVIHANDGDDLIFNVSTGDSVFGGEGNDTIVTDTGVKRIDGGEGIDVLTMTDANINFTLLDGYRVDFIEALGLEGNGSQTVTLDATAIRNIVDDENDLTFSEGSIVVFGDDSDHLILLGDYDPIGTDFFDIRTAGTFEEFIWLQQNSTSTGTTSVYIDSQISAEVQRLDGSKDVYGSAGDDDIQAGGDIVPTANDDVIDGRDGNDFIDGGAGNDLLFGGHGNDTIVYDPVDTGTVDGGIGFDTLLDTTPGATINLNGVGNLTNFERVDMRDGDGSDSLALDVAGLTGLIGDNSLESLLPDGQLKFVVDGDAGDQFNLSGVNVHSTDIATLAASGWVTNGVEADYLGQGAGNHYLKLTNGGLDIFVHEDVANVI